MFSPASAIFAVVVLFLRVPPFVFLLTSVGQKTYDAYEMISETFDKLYLFVLRLNESLNANFVTSTLLETYALVVIDVFKIVLLATKYTQRGSRTRLIFQD